MAQQDTEKWHPIEEIYCFYNNFIHHFSLFDVFTCESHPYLGNNYTTHTELKAPKSFNKCFIMLILGLRCYFYITVGITA